MRSNVKCQKSIRLILTERTSGVPPVIFILYWGVICCKLCPIYRQELLCLRSSRCKQLCRFKKAKRLLIVLCTQPLLRHEISFVCFTEAHFERFQPSGGGEELLLSLILNASGCQTGKSGNLTNMAEIIIANDARKRTESLRCRTRRRE